MKDLGLSLIKNALKADGIKARFLRGSMWSVAGTGISKALMLLSFMIVARIIGKESYGELGIIRSTLNMFTLLAGMGLGNTLAKYIAEYRNKRPQFAYDVYLMSNRLGVGFALIIGLLLIIFAPTIAEVSLQAPHLTNSVRFGAIVIFFTAINGIQSGSLSGLEQFSAMAKINIVYGAVELVLIIILAYLWNVEGCVIALGLSRLVLYILNKILITKKMREIPHELQPIDHETYSVLWKFALPSLGASLLFIPVLWWSKTFLVAHAGYGDMAILDVADQWSTIALFVPGILAQILLPFLSNTRSEGEYKKYNKLITYNILANGIIAGAIALIVILFRNLIMASYGKSFDNSLPLCLLMISSIFVSICNVVGQVIASQGKMWIGFGFNALWCIWMVIFSYYFVHLGAVGISLATLISYTQHFFGQGVYVLFVIKRGRMSQITSIN